MHTHRCTLALLLAPASFALLGCSSDPPAPPHKAYVGLFGDNVVAVVDIDAGAVLSTIDVAAPDGIVITPDGTKVYVSSNTAGTVTVIDTSTDAVAIAIDVGAQPAGLSITNDGAHVLVSVQGAGTASIIDTTTNKVVAAPAVAKAHNSAISANGSLGFVASQDTTAPAINVIALPGGTITTTLPVDKTPRAVAERSGTLYVTVAGTDAIEILDATTGTTTAQIATGGSPHDIRTTRDQAKVLTVSQTANELEIIDPDQNVVASRIPTGTMPHWIGLGADGSSAYVTNETDGTITVMDLTTDRVRTTLDVGKQPRKLAIAP